MTKKQDLKVKFSLVDKLVGYFSPKAQVNRMRSRMALSTMQSFGYVHSGSEKRSMKGWGPGIRRTADADTLPNIEQMRADSRDLNMNAPVAGGALKRMRTNVVGSGIYLQSVIDHEFLGISEEAAREIEKDIERKFSVWADSKDCDAARMQNFYELQASAFFNVSLSGDVFAALPYIKRKNMPFDLRVQMIEADYCSNPDNMPDDHTIAGGIEVDGNGAPLKYHFRVEDYLTFDPRWVAVNVFGSRTGRRNVLHLMEKERIGQRRGIPTLTPVVEMLKNLSRLSEAELMSSILSSFFTVFVKHSTPGSEALAGSIPDELSSIPTDYEGNPIREEDKNTYEMGPANIIDLDEDEDITMADPNRPNALFDPFFVAIVKQIGARIEVPFEQLLLHFGNSYSASRAVLQEAWKFYLNRRTWLNRNFNTPIYIEWLTEAVAKGIIAAPGFFSDPFIKAAWCGCMWGGSGMGQIDPLKESKAAGEKLDRNLTTHELEFVAIHGGAHGGWRAAMSRRANEENYLKEIGLVSEPVDSTEEATPPIEEQNTNEPEGQND